MRIEIGRVGDGGAADVATAVARRLVLVVYPTREKTRAVRPVVRWWLANGLRRGVVWAEELHQYSDLATMLHEVGTPIEPPGARPPALFMLSTMPISILPFISGRCVKW